MKRLLAVVIACSFFASAFALDFGALVALNAGYGDDGLVFSTGVSPWLSAALKGEDELYLSANFSIAWEDGAWSLSYGPERFELVLRPSPGTGFHIGRQRLSDGAGLVVAGLYDGFAYQGLLGNLRVSAGAFYTGLLDKKKAGILLSTPDLDGYSDAARYFATSRVLGYASLKIPGNLSLSTEMYAQFDLNGVDAIHSQYLVLGGQLIINPQWFANLSLSAGLAQSDAVQFFMAARGGASWLIPGDANSKLSVDILWASGGSSALAAYRSINALPQGSVFSPALAGVLVPSLAYSLRASEAISVEIKSSAFVRSGEGGPSDSGMDNVLVPWLGIELGSSVRWALASDLNGVFGAGLFLPGTEAFGSDEPLRWKASLTALLSL